MPSLLDTIDRLTYTANSLHAIATSYKVEDVGPFTQAMLHSSLQDIIREADETEYNLFHFVRHPDDASMLGQGKLGRKEYKAATPLRTRHVTGKIKEEEPEVYLEAALRYLNRFHTIKPMPGTRTHLESLVERLGSAREQLNDLQKLMQENEKKVIPTAQIRQEEKTINELKVQLVQLRKRRDALSNTLKAKLHHSAPLKSDSKAIAGPSSQSPTCSTPRDQSGLFWSEIKSNKSDSLLDEELDMTGMVSLTSPIPVRRTEARPHPSNATLPKDKHKRQIIGKEVKHSMPARERGGSDVSNMDMNTTSKDMGDSDNSSDYGEPTIVVSKLSDQRCTGEPIHIICPESKIPSAAPQTLIQDKRVSDPPSAKATTRRTRITPEMERISIKIWSAIADQLIPNNNFARTGKLPNAKDTLIILETISSQAISESSSTMNSTNSSPSTRSTLSSILGIEIYPPPTGAPHQVLTALVLLTLLTSPNHNIPLITLKAQLAAKIESISTSLPERSKQTAVSALGTSSIGSRAIYGCVAKKLIKIDRGGGEQIVRFD